MRSWPVALCALLLLSGCTTTAPVSTSGPLIGHELVFTSAEQAPGDMDAFTFFWIYPFLEKFDTRVVRIILMPDGEERVVDPDATGPAGQYVRSDQSPDDATLAPAQFRGRTITMIFRSRNGRIRMPRGVGGFAFYKKTKDGTLNWRQPNQQVAAKVSVR